MILFVNVSTTLYPLLEEVKGFTSGFIDIHVLQSQEQFTEQKNQTCREADVHREREYRAAVTIQSWFRGCRVRAYLT